MEDNTMNNTMYLILWMEKYGNSKRLRPCAMTYWEESYSAAKEVTENSIRICPDYYMEKQRKPIKSPIKPIGLKWKEQNENN